MSPASASRHRSLPRRNSACLCCQRRTSPPNFQISFPPRQFNFISVKRKTKSISYLYLIGARGSSRCSRERAPCSVGRLSGRCRTHAGAPHSPGARCALVGFTSGGLSLYHLRKFVLLDTFSDIKEKVPHAKFKIKFIKRLKSNTMAK